MTKQHQITGLGPVHLDGSRKLFTVLRNPFVVTAAWLAAQAAQPEVGDMLELADDGTLTLLAAGAEAPAEKDEPETEKKNTGTDLSNGSEPSPFKQFKTKPLSVSAAEITDVADGVDGNYSCIFADGSAKMSSGGLIPAIGDYWVISTGAVEHDGVCPKDEFLANFEPVE